MATGSKSIAVFYQNDAYGKAGLTGVERALAMARPWFKVRIVASSLSRVPI